MIFYIDTSSSFLYTALYNDGDIISEKKLNLGKDLSKYTVDEVNKMFLEVNVKPSDIKKIIVVNGPGSFTGIRIGITLAKLMAFCLNIPIITISSLEAMKESIKTDKLIVPIINARHNSCYAAIYDNQKVIQEGIYMSLDKLKLILTGLNKDYLFVSNDSFDFETISYDPDFKRIIDVYKDNEDVPAHLVNPNYLKLTEAEENKMKEENND